MATLAEGSILPGAQAMIRARVQLDITELYSDEVHSSYFFNLLTVFIDLRTRYWTQSLARSASLLSFGSPCCCGGVTPIFVPPPRTTCMVCTAPCHRRCGE
jgi:hypothetical protein